MVAAPGTAGEQREVQAFHWGLVPTWAKDTKISSKMINARSETIAEKPAFRSSFAKHRMIIPMDGFYEWKRDMDDRRADQGGQADQAAVLHPLDRR